MSIHSGFANGICYGVNVNFAGLVPNGTGQITADGQLLIGSTAAPNIKTGVLTSPGSTINIGYAAPNITLDVATSVVTKWNTTSVNIANVAVGNGYFCIAPGGALTLGLPATSVLGDTISIVLNGATSFQITQGVGQQIRLGNNLTTAGAGGSLTSTAQGDAIQLVCMTANTLWVSVPGCQGNFLIV